MKLLRKLLDEAQYADSNTPSDIDRFLVGLNDLIDQEELVVIDFMDGERVSEIALKEGEFVVYGEEGYRIREIGREMSDLSKLSYSAEIPFGEVVKRAMRQGIHLQDVQ